MSTATKDRKRNDRKRRPEHEEADEQPRPNLAERAAEWDPDRRWFHPFIGTLGTYSLAGMPAWAHVSPWLMIPAGLGITGAAMYAARRAYSEQEYGEKTADSAFRITGTAGLAASAWATWAGQPDITPLEPSALGTLLLGGGVFGAMYAAMRGKAPERKNKLEQIRTEARRQHEEAKHERQIGHKCAQWQPIIDRALNDAGVKVYDWADTKAGECLYLIDSPDKPIKLQGLMDACGTIASLAAHLLAAQGVQLQAHQVRAEEGDAAHLFKLHISTKNRFAKDMAYPMDRPMGSIENPIRPGVFEDGEDLELSILGKHIFMVGATGSGKDVFTNNVVGESTWTNNALLWVGGTAKLMPQVWPWLAPWLRGLTDRPLLDRIAGEDPKKVLQMLADLYEIGTRRNKKLGPMAKHTPTPQDPAYVMVLVEASDFLRDHDDKRIKTFDGRTWSPSALMDVITRAFRSAGVGVFCASQYGLMEGSGSHGSYMMRNFTIRIAGKTMSHSDGSNTLVGLRGTDTTKLRNYTLLVQPDKEEPRLMPAKAHLLEGEEQIQPIAVRNTQAKPRSPHWVEDVLGDDHQLRWTRSENPELAAIAESLGLSWPEAPAEATANDQEQPDEADEAPVAPEAQDDPIPESDWPEPEYPQISQEEIDRMLEHANVKFEEAREDLERWGILGETMHKVHEMVRAENAPHWVSAGQLAFVIDRVDQGGDWDAAGRELIAELSGKPWDLEPEERDGQLGWPTKTIVERVRRFVTGQSGELDAPEIPEQNQTDHTPQHPLMHAAGVLRDRDADAKVTTGELARLMGRITDDMEDGQKRSAVIRLGRELGQFVKAERGRNGSEIRVGDIIQKAAEKST